MRLDTLFPGASFNLNGVCHTIQTFHNGKAVCFREDGAIVYLAGHTQADTWERRRFRDWFAQYNPLNI